MSLDEVLADVRAHMRGLKPPGHFDKVYKEECQFCFDTPESPGGLFINLKTFQVQAAVAWEQLGIRGALLPALATMVLGVAMVAAACCMQRCAASTPACRPLARATSSWTMPGRRMPCICMRHGARYGMQGREQREEGWYCELRYLHEAWRKGWDVGEG